MIRGMTFPGSYIACCGAKSLSDVLLTGLGRPLLILILYARFRIMEYILELCGISATGDIFRLYGGFFLCFFIV